LKVGYNKDIKLEEVEFHSYSYDYKHTTKQKLFEENYLLKQENERLNNKEERLIRRLEDLIIVGEQVKNEWAVDICKMIIKELKGDSSNGN